VVSPLFRHSLHIAAVDSFRPHAADEVYVTGTFDNWAKTEKLEKVDAGHFEKVVQLNKVDEKILYKVRDTTSLTPVMLLPQLAPWPILLPLLYPNLFPRINFSSSYLR